MVTICLYLAHKFSTKMLRPMKNHSLLLLYASHSFSFLQETSPSSWYIQVMSTFNTMAVPNTPFLILSLLPGHLSLRLFSLVYKIFPFISCSVFQRMDINAYLTYTFFGGFWAVSNSVTTFIIGGKPESLLWATHCLR